MQNGCSFCKTKEYEFFGISQWPDGHITWTITDLIPGLTFEQMKADIAWGYDLWAKYFGITHEYVSNARAARVLVGTRYIDGPSSVLAETELSNGQRQVRLWFDTGDAWIDQFDSGTRRIIVQLVGVHEEGHSIGFGHAPQGSRNIMSPVYNVNQRLAGDWDIQQGVMRYGQPKIIVPVPPSVPVPPVTPGVPAPTGGFNLGTIFQGIIGQLLKTYLQQIISDGTLQKWLTAIVNQLASGAIATPAHLEQHLVDNPLPPIS